MEPNQQRAFNFFFQTDLTQQQIADLLDINRRTLHRWMKEGGWKRAKYAASHAPGVLIEQYYEQLGQMNLKIAQRTEQPYPTKEESETIRRITATIKQMRSGHATCAESVEVFMGFTEKLRKKDMALLTDVLPHITQYIKSLAQDGRFLNYSHFMHEEAAFDKEYEQWCKNNPEPPQDGEAPSSTLEPLPPTPPSGGTTPNEVIPGEATLFDSHSFSDGGSINSHPEGDVQSPSFDGHSFSDGGSNNSHPEGDVQSPSPSERVGVRPLAPDITTNDSLLTTKKNVTSNGTSDNPENNLKPLPGNTPAQNDNPELSTKNIGKQCDIPTPKPTGRKVYKRTIEIKYTPNDRFF